VRNDARVFYEAFAKLFSKMFGFTLLSPRPFTDVAVHQRPKQRYDCIPRLRYLAVHTSVEQRRCLTYTRTQAEPRRSSA